MAQSTIRTFMRHAFVTLFLVSSLSFSAHAMDNNKTGIVLVHGSWHQGVSFSLVTDILKNDNYVVEAVTLPGAGSTAKHPESYKLRPLDPAAFGNEPSPTAGVSQKERTQAVIEAIKSVNAATGGKALVIGHSLGGLSVTNAAEKMSDKISGVVYISAFMFPEGVTAGEFVTHSSMHNSKIGNILLADPAVVGALRIDPKSSNSNYINTARQVLAADASMNLFKVALKDFTPDEPAQVLGAPSTATRSNYGQIPRYFVKLTEDKIIPPVSQDIMISRMDRAMKNKTTVYTIKSSHSPHLSQPNALAALVSLIAR